MELLLCLFIGVLFTVGSYLILSRSILRIIFGVMLLAHGAHLLLLTLSGLVVGAPPLLGENALSYNDPLPQALILTSIVISFGVTAFLLVLSYRMYQEHGSDDLENLRGIIDE